jgi:hypothetical protein
MSQVKVGDEYRNWCQQCKKKTIWKYVKIERKRICIAYDGGGGKYDNFTYLTVKCSECGSEFTNCP